MTCEAPCHKGAGAGRLQVSNVPGVFQSAPEFAGSCAGHSARRDVGIRVHMASAREIGRCRMLDFGQRRVRNQRP